LHDQVYNSASVRNRQLTSTENTPINTIGRRFFVVCCYFEYINHHQDENHFREICSDIATLNSRMSTFNGARLSPINVRMRYVLKFNFQGLGNQGGHVELHISDDEIRRYLSELCEYFLQNYPGEYEEEIRNLNNNQNR
jgi:hypothetical protein